MSKSFSIRPATLDDFDAYFEVFASVVAEGRWLGAQLPLDRDQSHERWAGWIDSATSSVLLAVSDDEQDWDDPVLGWITVERSPHGLASIGMGVGEASRGQGVGRALVDAAVAWAHERGAHKVTLQVWPHNHAAIALYERAGFVQEGRLVRQWRRKTGELWDAIVMGLVLDHESPGSPW